MQACRSENLVPLSTILECNIEYFVTVCKLVLRIVLCSPDAAARSGVESTAIDIKC